MSEHLTRQGTDQCPEGSAHTYSGAQLDILKLPVLKQFMNSTAMNFIQETQEGFWR